MNESFENKRNHFFLTIEKTNEISYSQTINEQNEKSLRRPSLILQLSGELSLAVQLYNLYLRNLPDFLGITRPFLFLDFIYNEGLNVKKESIFRVDYSNFSFNPGFFVCSWLVDFKNIIIFILTINKYLPKMNKCM